MRVSLPRFYTDYKISAYYVIYGGKVAGVNKGRGKAKGKIVWERSKTNLIRIANRLLKHMERKIPLIKEFIKKKSSEKDVENNRSKNKVSALR